MNPPGVCSVCSQAVPSDSKYVTCSECKNCYDLGLCAGIKEPTYCTMGPVKRDKWRCRPCQSADSSSTQSSLFNKPQGDVATEGLGGINAKLDQLLSLKASVDTLITLPAQVDELLTLKPVVHCLQETVKRL